MLEGLLAPAVGRSHAVLIGMARAIGALATAVGLLVCIGWIGNIPALRVLIPGFPEMRLNSAIAFVLSGVAVACLADGSVMRVRIGKVCAVAVMALAALTLIQYAAGIDLHIDQILIADHGNDSPYPGRIPLLGCVNFLLLGASLCLLDTRTSDGRWPAQLLALIVSCIAFVLLLGVSYDAASLYRLHASAPVALHGMILFLLLGFGALFARPDRGVMARVLAQSASGIMVRRLLPAAIAIPPALGWVRLQGQDAGFFGNNLGVALYATANVAIFSTLIWTTATAVGHADAKRRAAEQKARGQLARLDLLNHITQAIGERQDLRSVFQVVVRSLEDNLPVDFAAIAVYDAVAQVLSIECVGARSHSLAAHLSLPEKARIPIDANGLARCVRGVLVYEPDISGSQFAFPKQLAGAGLRSLVFSPMRADSGVFGVLIVARLRSNDFISGECEFLLQVSSHVAVAARQSQLHQALQTAYDDLRQSQDSVVQHERLRSLGQMASGIAHDINNALSPAALYTEALLERETGMSPQGREKLVFIDRAIDDVAGTVARMRGFYRRRESELQLASIDLNRLVSQVAEFTRARWRDQPQERGVTIDLQTDLEPLLPAVMGAQTEIRDALTNLIFNAVDAMPEGGSLCVRTRGLSGRYAGVDPTALTHVSLEVIDTGAGMDEETRRRCLEPFYTTKGERGSGLGLAMVYGMVQRHSADLEIASEIGKGTSVRLVFPTTLSDFAATMTSGIRPVIGRLRVLVVDDDPLLIKSLRDTLENDGHVVTTADGGQEGVQTFQAAQRRHEPFAVVITDLGMPYFDGRRVAAAIRATAPNVPIILLTGWGERLISENELPANIDRVLAKPPKLSQLRMALAELTLKRADPAPASRAQA